MFDDSARAYRKFKVGFRRNASTLMPDMRMAFKEGIDDLFKGVLGVLLIVVAICYLAIIFGFAAIPVWVGLFFDGFPDTPSTRAEVLLAWPIWMLVGCYRYKIAS